MLHGARNPAAAFEDLQKFKGTASISRPWLGLLPIVDLAQICIRLGTWYMARLELILKLDGAL